MNKRPLVILAAVILLAILAAAWPMIQALVNAGDKNSSGSPPQAVKQPTKTSQLEQVKQYHLAYKKWQVLHEQAASARDDSVKRRTASQELNKEHGSLFDQVDRLINKANAGPPSEAPALYAEARKLNAQVQQLSQELNEMSKENSGPINASHTLDFEELRALNLMKAARNVYQTEDVDWVQFESDYVAAIAKGAGNNNELRQACVEYEQALQELDDYLAKKKHLAQESEKLSQANSAAGSAYQKSCQLALADPANETACRDAYNNYRAAATAYRLHQEAKYKHEESAREHNDRYEQAFELVLSKAEAPKQF